MDYFELLGLTREPFSNSPDPAFFFESSSHVPCLHRLEIAIRLRRGLNICLGEIGTGKTTLCRTLIQHLDRDPAIVPHLILDPYYTTGLEFLYTLHHRFLGTPPAKGASRWEITEALKAHLFHETLENGKTLVLIIDEGQKLCLECLESLRELLNYETNDAKLLQVVIFAQNEFTDMLAKQPNFQDRINEQCALSPLNFQETKKLIRHRLRMAGTTKELFTRRAYRAMFEATQGRPRKIMHLGHKVLLSLIMNNRTKASRNIVLTCARAQSHAPASASRRWFLLLLGGVLTAMIVLASTNIFHQQGQPDRSELPFLSDQQGQSAGQGKHSGPVLFPDVQEKPAEVPLHAPPGPQDTSGAEHSPEESVAEQETPLSTPALPEANLGKPVFFAQIGSFLSEQNALEAAARFRTKNYEAQVREIQRGSKPWFVVLVKSFEDVGAGLLWVEEFRNKEGHNALLVEINGAGYQVLGPAQE